jgi:hypothetical protein
MGQAHDAIVFRSLREQGNAVTRRFSVLNTEAASDELNASFIGTRLLPGTGIQLLSASASLSVAEKDRDFAAKQATIARQADADAAELAAKHTHLMRLRELFLRDTATAMLWWSDGDRDRMLGLADHEKQFDTMVRLITGSPHGTAPPDEIAPLVASFLADLGPDHRRFLISQLAKVFESYHRPDLAEELRRSE